MELGRPNSTVLLKHKDLSRLIIKIYLMLNWDNDFYEWIKSSRNKMKTKEIFKKTREKLIGHYNYYGYYVNISKLYHYYWEVIKSMFKWLNRRSQKVSFNLEKFKRILVYNNIPKPPALNKLKRLERSLILCQY